MLRDAFFITRKELQYQLRARETLLWVFLMPIVFFYFIGTVTKGFSSSPTGGSDKLIIVEGDEVGFLAEQLKLRLKDRNFELSVVAEGQEDPESRRRLYIPGGFSRSVQEGQAVKLRFVDDNRSTLGANYDQMRIGRAVYSLLADLIVSSEEGTADEAAIERLNQTPRALSLQVEAAGQRKRIPTGFEQAIPGIMVMFTLMVMATSGAVLLVIERNQGLLRRLASSPISRTSVASGKWAGKLALGVVQISFAMLTGWILFSMNWGPNLPFVCLLMLAYAALMAALGLLMGNLVNTEGQAIAIGVVAANVLAALGGCWWPIEITPRWMQSMQLFLPTGWAMDGLHKLVSFGAPVSSVLPHILGMSLGTVVLVWISARVFRYQ